MQDYSFDPRYHLDGQRPDEQTTWTTRVRKGWRLLKRAAKTAHKVLQVINKVMDVTMDVIEIIEATVQREFGGTRAAA